MGGRLQLGHVSGELHSIDLTENGLILQDRQHLREKFIAAPHQQSLINSV
jgi:hypothetical protein